MQPTSTGNANLKPALSLSSLHLHIIVSPTYFIWTVYLLHEDSLPEKRPLPRSEIFAESKNAGSRQRKRLPRAALGKHQPSATDRIAVGLPLSSQQLSAKWAILPRAALGKKCPSAKRSFVVGRPLGKIRLSAKHCRGP